MSKDDGHGKGSGGSGITDAVSKFISNAVVLTLTAIFIGFVIWGGWNYLDHGTVAGQPQNAGMPGQKINGQGIRGQPNKLPDYRPDLLPRDTGTAADIAELRRRAGKKVEH